MFLNGHLLLPSKCFGKIVQNLKMFEDCRILRFWTFFCKRINAFFITQKLVIRVFWNDFKKSKINKIKIIVITASNKMQKIALKYKHTGLGDMKNVHCSFYWGMQGFM